MSSLSSGKIAPTNSQLNFIVSPLHPECSDRFVREGSIVRMVNGKMGQRRREGEDEVVENNKTDCTIVLLLAGVCKTIETDFPGSIGIYIEREKKRGEEN